ncbi:hypothetical protein M3225_28910, partial [Priestia aryabhattai]|nr:hypothetical protein [Priestia aryabhattai]
AGFASTVFIPVTQFLVDLAGWRLALVALAACNLIICLPIHVFAIRSSRIDPNAAQPSAERTAVDAAATRRALRTPTFWALALCFTTYYATFAALTFHLVPLMVERGVTNTVLDITMALIGPAQVIARAVWFAFDRKVTITTVGFIVVTLFPV